MTKTFKNQVLIEADHVDSVGDLIPREVLEKAVADAQDLMDKGTPLLITKRFSNKLKDTQGLVSSIRMDGALVVIDGVILDTDAGLAVQDLGMDEVEYALGGIGTPSIDKETNVRTYENVSISTVSAVPKGEKVR